MPEHLPAARAEHQGGLLLFRSLGLHQRNQLARNKGKGDKYRRQHNARKGKHDLQIPSLQRFSEPALKAEHQNIDQAGHHWRHGERKVNQGDQNLLAAEFKLAYAPGGGHAKHQIQWHGNSRRQQGQAYGGQCVGIEQRVPVHVHTLSECLIKDRCQRKNQEQEDECQGDAHQGPSDPGRLSQRRTRVRVTHDQLSELLRRRCQV